MLKQTEKRGTPKNCTKGRLWPRGGGGGRRKNWGGVIRARPKEKWSKLEATELKKKGTREEGGFTGATTVLRGRGGDYE